MKLSEIVKKYRQENQISMDDFAKRCNLSKGYISMLERDVNPRSKKSISPSLSTINSLSKGMNIDIDTLLKMMEPNENINLIDRWYVSGDTETAPINTIINNKKPLTSYEQNLITGYRQLNSLGQKQLHKQLQMMLNDDDYKKDTGSNTEEAM